MITKTISANGSKGHHTFTLYVEESRVDSKNSYMYYSFQLSPIQTGWDWAGWGNSIGYSINIGDNTYTGSIPNYNGSSTVTLSTRSNVQIPHNEDGTKSINISFSVVDGAGQRYTCGNASNSSSLELSRLHKAPSLKYTNFAEKNSQLLPQMNNTIVNLLSKIQFNLTYTTYDNAKISDIKFYDQFGKEYFGNGKSTVINSAGGSITIDFKILYLRTNILTEKPRIEIIDSLGSKSTITLNDFTVIQYTNPTLIPTSSSVKRNGQLSGKVNLNLVGTFTNKKISSITNNFTLKFKYWKSSDVEPSTYYDIPKNVATVSGNNININKWAVAKNGVVITDVNKNFNYTFKFEIKDSFNNSEEIILTCSKGTWIMCKFKDRVDFNKITIKGKSIIPETIYEGEIVGGDSISLPKTRRFLEVYAKIEFEIKNITIKYTIDTSLNSNECYGSALMTPFDEPILDTIYISEAQYNKSTKILAHTRTGFFNTGNGAYSDRNNNTSYAIYRIDTHD